MLRVLGCSKLSSEREKERDAKREGSLEAVEEPKGYGGKRSRERRENGVAREEMRIRVSSLILISRGETTSLSVFPELKKKMPPVNMTRGYHMVGHMVTLGC